jgi:type IV pilus assembly protein PilA
MLDRLQRERGFALIELLIAMLIIGALAAIAIPSFLTQRQKSQDTCAKSQVRTMQTTMETVYTEIGNYAGVDMNRLHSAEGAVVPTGACGSGTAATVGMISGGACNGSVPTVARAYCVSQTSASGRNFVLANNDGALTRVCSPSGGGCRNGVW